MMCARETKSLEHPIHLICKSAHHAEWRVRRRPEFLPGTLLLWFEVRRPFFVFGKFLGHGKYLLNLWSYFQVYRSFSRRERVPFPLKAKKKSRAPVLCLLSTFPYFFSS